MKTLLQNIKFLINKTFSNRQKIQGKCKKCGECCRNIVFYVGKNPIKTQEQFELLKKWDKKYKNFEIYGTAPDGAIYFKCKSLKDNGSCNAYLFRSLACRMYPKYSASFFSRGEGLKKDCGYYFSPQKTFKEFLK